MTEVPEGKSPRDGAFIGGGSSADLARSFVNDGTASYVAIRSDGTVVFASETTETILGRPASQSVGTNIMDWVHPEDAERAMLQLTELGALGSVPGIGVFRVRNADGSWVPVEVMGCVVNDGKEQLLGVHARYAGHRLFLEQLLAEMISGTERAHALRLVCDGIPWESIGSNVAIAWTDERETRQVSTGVPDSLGGCDFAGDTPWERSRRSGVAEQGSVSDLDEARQALAREFHLGAYWVEPVVWAAGLPPATITIWTAEGPRAPFIHAYGMGVVRHLVELVMRWTAHTSALDRAARSDPLTGLANHGAFFDELSRATEGGAVLYCDLDHFKPVNDHLGHMAGDTVLRVAARRLEGCIREGDFVGRLGGDEFAVLCRGLDEAEGVAIAERILTSLQEPLHLPDVGEVRIGVSIGVAASSSPMNESLVHAADRALSAAKSGGKGRVCLASAG